MRKHGKKNKTLGAAQTRWGTLPQTPIFKPPTPDLRGLPLRRAQTSWGSKYPHLLNELYHQGKLETKKH